MLNKHLIAQTRPTAHPANVICWKNRRITLLTDSLFRIEESATMQFCDDATQAVWFRDMQPVKHSKMLTATECMIQTAAVTLHMLDTLEDSYVLLADGRKALLVNDGNLQGTYRTLDCCDGSCWIPFSHIKEEPHDIQLENGVLSRSGVAIYDDSKSLLVKADGTVAPRETKETDIYVFAYGNDYRGAIRGLYQISGAPVIIPRYALGNWWSRYWAYSQREYLSLMSSFEEQGLPFTIATVDMDWHPSDNLPDGEDGWTGYTWNEKLFPDYRAFLKELHERNYHVTLNVHPALGVRWFEAQYEEMARRVGIDPATKKPVEFDMTDDDFINAYFELLHKPYEEAGVDFWWIDWQQGTKSAMDGLDPLWSLNHYHTLDIAKEKDALILSRYAGIGSHRYPLGFSGDTHMTWKSLEHLISFTFKASNAGYSWWSHDIGGHMFGYKDNELFVRFVQFGVFSPINRLHSSKARALTKEITSYTGGTGLIAREYLKLRHAMIPFLYTASCETTEKGLALIEPMYYQYPNVPEAYECEGQYLFGRQMIAAPITEKSGENGMTVKRVWLPGGLWTDFFTGDTYEGGGWVEMIRPLDTFPLLVKEGGFFVLDGAPQGNSTALPKLLDVHVFAGTGKYELIEDDGTKRAQTRFVAQQISNTQQVLVVYSEDPDNILPKRGMKLRFRSVMDGTVKVLCNNDEMEVSTYQGGNYTVVELADWTPGATYQVVINEQASDEDKRNEAMVRIVTQAEGGNDVREHLMWALFKCKTGEEACSVISASELTNGWKKRLLEVYQQNDDIKTQK